jgi:hypothetical protein
MRCSAVLGFFAVLVFGTAVMYPLPGLYPNDTDGGRAISWVFWAVTSLPVAAVVLWFRFDRFGRVVVGILAGYVVWLALFMLWLSAGP